MRLLSATAACDCCFCDCCVRLVFATSHRAPTEHLQFSCRAPTRPPQGPYRAQGPRRAPTELLLGSYRAGLLRCLRLPTWLLPGSCRAPALFAAAVCDSCSWLLFMTAVMADVCDCSLRLLSATAVSATAVCDCCLPLLFATAVCDGCLLRLFCCDCCLRLLVVTGAGCDRCCLRLLFAIAVCGCCVPLLLADCCL